MKLRELFLWETRWRISPDRVTTWALPEISDTSRISKILVFNHIPFAVAMTAQEPFVVNQPRRHVENSKEHNTCNPRSRFIP